MTRTSGVLRERWKKIQELRFLSVSFLVLGLNTLGIGSESAEEVSVVLHVGTNDTPKSGSELIMGRLRQAIRACWEARSGVRVTVCAIPSRLDKGGITWSRSEGVNDRLKELCIA